MSTDPDVIGQEEIRYFGKVTASISHELKNVLAILNEHAGLLQDFVAMAAQGRPLDVERIRQLSDGMLKQIGRGDTIVRNMNRFAHTADHERATADLAGLVELSVQMFGRTAAARGETVQVQTPGQQGGIVIQEGRFLSPEEKLANGALVQVFQAMYGG